MRRIWLVAGLAVPVWASAAAPKASSELKDGDGTKYTADKAFDGLLKTGWAEAESGAGNGAWLELKLDRATDFSEVSVWPGNLSQGSRSVREYGRPTKITVTATTKAGPVTASVVVPDLVNEGPKRLDIVFPAPVVGATVLRVTVDEAVEGYVHEGTFIAEVAIDFTSKTPPESVVKALAWDGTRDEATLAKNKEQVVTWYDAIAKNDLGDSEAFAKIADQAADGSPAGRDRLKAVPVGYRAQALAPDDVAVEALLKLKDPNAIGAITLASLRSQGKAQKLLEKKVEYFQAYAELLGGGDKNLPAWGKTGWEVGAIRTWGEPLAIVVNSAGQALVTDVGNSRIERFGADGFVDKTWGGEPEISDVWFGKERKYYVSGGTPGDKPGQFENPVDITLIPAKDGDGFAVLDTKGRVQVFDGAGAPTATWKIRTDDVLEAGVGGSGFIEQTGGKLVVAWLDQAFVYNLTGEELATWAIPDGRPNNAVALPKGKVGFAIADQLVMFSVDGFRHGEILKGDERGEGFENWDAALDADGKLWLVTDTGLAIKYKKPGKVEYSVSISDTPFLLPRIAVSDGRIWVADRDEIVQVDALELHTKAELAADEAKGKGK